MDKNSIRPFVVWELRYTSENDLEIAAKLWACKDSHAYHYSLVVSYVISEGIYKKDFLGSIRNAREVILDGLANELTHR